MQTESMIWIHTYASYSAWTARVKQVTIRRENNPDIDYPHPLPTPRPGTLPKSGR